MNAGKLKERVRVERAMSTPDGRGGSTRTWSELSTLWASVLPTGGKEALLNEAMQSVQGYRVTMRHGCGVRPEDRLVWGDVVMNVRSAADPDGQRRWWVIFADAGVVTE